MTTETLPRSPAPPPGTGPEWLPRRGTYAVAPDRGIVELTARLGPVATLRGRLDLTDAALTVADDPADCALHIEMNSASLRTGRLLGDGRLRGSRGLYATRHKRLVFRSESIEPADDGQRLEVHGDLEVRGVPLATTLRLRVAGRAADRLLVVGAAEVPYRPLRRATGFTLPRTAPAGRLRLLVAAEFT
ncbi:YceI family protein [Streptomyces sp. NPDC005962]|uniref:YceI family protein n=1 Tax=Streptomyces sp. NPDC005962 TaxID=3154466 RepID=UPI0033E86ADC